jgi:hypothetical protein
MRESPPDRHPKIHGARDILIFRLVAGFFLDAVAPYNAQRMARPAAALGF